MENKNKKDLPLKLELMSAYGTFDGDTFVFGTSDVTGLPKCKDCDNEELNGWSSHCKGCNLPIVY